jgi:hypothetical protein
MTQDARALMCDQLRAVGFSEVTMLSKPCQASDAVERARAWWRPEEIRRVGKAKRAHHSRLDRLDGGHGASRLCHPAI